MSDSIFDLKQTLFTSNLPVSAPRDRGQERGPNFDQALDSAQRQSRDEHRAHGSQTPHAAGNKKTDDIQEMDDAPHDDQDEVTLTKEGAESATKNSTANAEETVAVETESAEEITEPTAAEIAAAAAAPLAPTPPAIKQVPKDQSEHAEHPEDIELNDAVQPGGKRGRVKSAGKETPAANTQTNAAPITDEELAATTEDAAKVDPNAVIVAAEHSTKLAAANKNERAANKLEQTKSDSAAKTKHSTDAETKPNTGEHAEGAFAVTVTPETEGTAPAPKRRSETSRQSMPEVHESELKLASTFAVNTAAATSTDSTDATPETTTKTAKTPDISPVSTSPTETATPPNHLRGQPVPTSFANRLEAAAAERKSNDPLNGVDRTRFVQRVARAFQRAGETEGEIRLRLSPPELGAVKLEVALRDGAMIARLETETTAARNLLMENLPQLKERLAEQNVRIETFEVEVRDPSNQSSADDAREQLRQQTEQQRNRLRGERATTPVVAAPIVRTLPAARQSSQLNVVI